MLDHIQAPLISSSRRVAMSTHHPEMTRRAFLSAAAAASVPVLLSGSLQADEKKAPANERLGIGFIGVGTMNRGHLGHFLGQNDVQVLAVCDVDTTRRENAKMTVEKRYADKTKSGEYKGCFATKDFREVLARKDIDAVVIATPDHWHAIPAIEACKAGKDVYCEKPLSLTIREAKAMIDAARKYDRVFQTGSQQRSENGFRTACELVRSGRIGKLTKVYVNVGSPSRPCDLKEEEMEKGLDWDLWLGPAPMRPYSSVLSPRGVHQHFPNWRNYREYSGGMMTDWGAHHFDIAQWGIGMDESGPSEIIPPGDPKAERGIRYLYANGVEMIHGESFDNRAGVQFIGTEGIINVNRGYINSIPSAILKEPLGEMDVKLYKSPGHQRDWLNCIRSRKKPICDVEVGARSVTVCHLGNLAYWNHRKLKWDAKEWRFLDDEEANKWLDRERRGPWQLPKI
jgi:predicted dehydrogenase